MGGAAVLTYFAIAPTTLGVEGYGIDFRPSVAVAVDTLLAALAVGTAASLFPAFDAARRPLHVAVKGGE